MGSRSGRRRIVAEAVDRGKWVDAAELTPFFRDIRRRHLLESLTFLCIGTDCSSGDALGPLVGTRLLYLGFPNVIGTLAHPCDSSNFAERVRQIPEGHSVIAIDACLGTPSSVGRYILGAGPLTPAGSVGGGLAAAGDYSIAAVVNIRGLKPYSSLQMTSLHRVMNMVDEIAGAAADAFDMPV
ncbi:spore protease YyaC [Paenibacillus sp. J22TS3]|uniref:spore protease YyaC n=1 Tax=Paenibacillus sp. J22TS3 TaxID=2807192 RepID=UPI001B26D139|nr:spore protease YyaC [Paenibacillus sp. J22TS3]GIP24394.1 hypothetical protein J22TS3_46690 [Paenibacillus sp. J22TS3]